MPRHRPVSEIARPYPVPAAADSFKLWKGGRSGKICFVTAANGVQSVNISIDLFTPKEIADRWGFDSNYWVHFSRVKEDGRRVVMGSPKQFGLADPRLADAPPESHTAIVVPHANGGGGDIGAAMTVLGGLRSMVLEESRAAIASADARCTAAIESERIRSRESTELTLKLFGMVLPMQQQQPQAFFPQPAAPDPAIARQLAELAASNAALQARIKELEEDEDEEETDDERIERLQKKVKSAGVMAAVQEYMGEESVAELFRMLPKIKAKIPEVVAFLTPLIKENVEAFTSKAKAPPPAPPPPAAAPVEVRQAPRAAPPPPPSPPPPPPPAPAPPDEFTPRVK